MGEGERDRLGRGGRRVTGGLGRVTGGLGRVTGGLGRVTGVEYMSDISG